MHEDKLNAVCELHIVVWIELTSDIEAEAKRLIWISQNGALRLS